MWRVWPSVEAHPVSFHEVTQTRTGATDGNCMAACLASFYGIRIEDAPDFDITGDRWWVHFQDFCLARGHLALTVRAGDCRLSQVIRPEGTHFAGGISPRGSLHLVVVEDGLLRWDPYPGGHGLETPEDWIVMIPLAQSIPARLLSTGGS